MESHKRHKGTDRPIQPYTPPAFIRNYAGISSTSTNTLITGTWGLPLGVAINEPDTGGINSGCRLTVTEMWLLSTTWPDVESKPFQPTPGRYTSDHAWVAPRPCGSVGA